MYPADPAHHFLSHQQLNGDHPRGITSKNESSDEVSLQGTKRIYLCNANA
jgi:hypothetical protein